MLLYRRSHGRRSLSRGGDVLLYRSNRRFRCRGSRSFQRGRRSGRFRSDSGSRSLRSGGSSRSLRSGGSSRSLRSGRGSRSLRSGRVCCGRGSFSLFLCREIFRSVLHRSRSFRRCGVVPVKDSPSCQTKSTAGTSHKTTVQSRLTNTVSNAVILSGSGIIVSVTAQSINSVRRGSFHYSRYGAVLHRSVEHFPLDDIRCRFLTHNLINHLLSFSTGYSLCRNLSALPGGGSACQGLIDNIFRHRAGFTSRASCTGTDKTSPDTGCRGRDKAGRAAYSGIHCGLSVFSVIICGDALVFTECLILGKTLTKTDITADSVTCGSCQRTSD